MEAVAEKKRRSHLNRRAMPKGVQITDNDIRDIFEPLSRHAQLTTRQLVAFGARHPIITKTRLGELWYSRYEQHGFGRVGRQRLSQPGDRGKTRPARPEEPRNI
jgi:hypothetical protein